jgi:general secretion pathway protein A
MYLTFYGLSEKPFNATPDPKFLYLTPGHREALAQLLYGVQEHKGFIVLTGEVGTGKTTLLQALLQRLDGNAAVAFIFNSTLSFDGLFEYMLEDFGIAQSAMSQAQRLFAFNNFLIERRRAGQNTVLILDEAQNLDPPTLEKVRLLSNFETRTEKLLQILLVGQPELEAKLQLPGLRQLRQRIGLHWRVPCLTRQEAGDYIRTRLRIAGLRDLGLFTDRAVARISEYADGIPRVINILCDHCLLYGYADQKRRIDSETVEQAVDYFENGRRQRRGAWGLSLRRALAPAEWWLLASIAALAVGMTVLTIHPEFLGDVPGVAARHLLDFARSVRELLAMR